jgi:DNA-binding NarL/FixJ family response regulator
MDELTNTELKILQLIFKGYSTHEISTKISRSIRTIEKRRLYIGLKLGTKTVFGTMMEAIRLGLFDQEQLDIQYEYPVDEKIVLSQIEKLVLHETLKGFTASEIINESNIVRENFSYIQKEINRKWKVDSKVDLILKAIKHGYLKILSLKNTDDEEGMRVLWDAVRSGGKVPKYRIIFTNPKDLTQRQ